MNLISHSSEGRERPSLRQDEIFFSRILSDDAVRHRATLRSMAALDYPSTPLCNLLIQIDYTQVPETYSVKPIVSTLCSLRQGTKARILLEELQKNPGKKVIVK